MAHSNLTIFTKAVNASVKTILFKSSGEIALNAKQGQTKANVSTSFLSTTQVSTNIEMFIAHSKRVCPNELQYGLC